VPLVKSSVQQRLFVATKESRERMVEWRGRSVAVAVMAMAVLGLVAVQRATTVSPIACRLLLATEVSCDALTCLRGLS